MKKIERSQHVSDWIWKSLGSQPSCLKNKTTKTHVTKERENKCEKVGDLQVQSWEWWGEPREVADMQPSRAWYGPKGGRGGVCGGPWGLMSMAMGMGSTCLHGLMRLGWHAMSSICTGATGWKNVGPSYNESPKRSVLLFEITWCYIFM